MTYFFNGGVEKPFGGEERILVPSPKVATYDLKPEMSAQGITDTVVKAIEKGEFDAIIMNYANADMVGHSGNLEATIKAVEAVDAGLGQIYQAMKPRGGSWIITADHGNAETMIDPATGGPHTYHTTNPVPFLCITENSQLKLAQGGASERYCANDVEYFGRGSSGRHDWKRFANEVTTVARSSEARLFSNSRARASDRVRDVRPLSSRVGALSKTTPYRSV